MGNNIKGKASEIPGIVLRRVDDPAHPRHGRMAQVMLCSKNPEHFLVLGSAQNGGSFPKAPAFKLARNKGWTASSKGKHLCPECFAASGKKRPGLKPGQNPQILKKQREEEDRIKREADEKWTARENAAARAKDMKNPPPNTQMSTQLASILGANTLPPTNPVREEDDVKHQHIPENGTKPVRHTDPALSQKRMKAPDPAPEVETPPEIDRVSKQRIFRALDEAYDMQGQRYLMEHTDTSVSKVLHLPLPWIVQVREEMFGPSGPDMDLVKLQKDINDALDKLSALETASLDIATQAEEALTELRDLQKRMIDMLSGA